MVTYFSLYIPLMAWYHSPICVNTITKKMLKHHLSFVLCFLTNTTIAAFIRHPIAANTFLSFKTTERKRQRHRHRQREGDKDREQERQRHRQKVRERERKCVTDEIKKKTQSKKSRKHRQKPQEIRWRQIHWARDRQVGTFLWFYAPQTFKTLSLQKERNAAKNPSPLHITKFVFV